MKSNILGCLSAALVLFFATNTLAQCSSGHVFSNRVIHHHHKVVSTPIIKQKSYGGHHVVKNNVVAVKEVPVAVPVLVPAFQFQYQAPVCCPPVVQAQPQYVQSPPVIKKGNHGVPSTQVGSGSHDKIRALAKALLEEMDKQVSPSGAGELPPVAIDPYAPQQPIDRSAKPPVGRSNLPPGINPHPIGMTPEQAAPLAMAALQKNCASCHTGVSSKADVVIFTNPGVFNPQAPWRIMSREISAGRMPPRYSQFRLTEKEKEAVSVWLKGI